MSITSHPPPGKQSWCPVLSCTQRARVQSRTSTCTSRCFLHQHSPRTCPTLWQHRQTMQKMEGLQSKWTNRQRARQLPHPGCCLWFPLAVRFLLWWLPKARHRLGLHYPKGHPCDSRQKRWHCHPPGQSVRSGFPSCIRTSQSQSLHQIPERNAVRFQLPHRSQKCTTCLRKCPCSLQYQFSSWFFLLSISVAQGNFPNAWLRSCVWTMSCLDISVDSHPFTAPVVDAVFSSVEQKIIAAHHVIRQRLINAVDMTITRFVCVVHLFPSSVSDALSGYCIPLFILICPLKYKIYFFVPASIHYHTFIILSSIF